MQAKNEELKEGANQVSDMSLTKFGGAVHIELKEGAGFTGGAAETIYNANRNGPAAPFAALSDPTNSLQNRCRNRK